MPNYQNAKIYKLINNVDGEIYVGATVDRLCARKWDHQKRARICPDRLVYKHLNVIGWQNVDIVLIEDFPCENRVQLHTRERHHIEQLQAKLNTIIPTRTKKESHAVYYQQNKAKLNQKNKEYYEKNREKWKAYDVIKKEKTI